MNKKRLFFDIETSPLVVYSWNVGNKIRLTPDNIIEERAIICISYKWEHEEEVHTLTWNSSKSDKGMLKKFVAVMEQADEVVAHNGDGFDIPWIRGRCLIHGIKVPPTIDSIDTLKLARRLFRLPSNKLDYLAQLLFKDKKLSTGGFSLWKDVCGNNRKEAMEALETMAEYCEKDVILLEKVFHRINPYAPNKINYAMKSGLSVIHCPECSSNKTYCSKTRVSAAGIKRRQMNCKSCGKYFTIADSKYQTVLN